MMQIKINPLEVAEELAHQAVMNEFLSVNEHEDFVNEGDLYENPTDVIENYKPVVMEAYQRHVDYFFEILTNNEVTYNYKTALNARKHELIFEHKETIDFVKKYAREYNFPHGVNVYEINNSFYTIKLKSNE